MSRLRVALVATGLCALSASQTLWVRPAQADDAAASKAACTLSGTAQMPVDLTIYDKPDGGNAIARFTGGDTPLVALDFFADGGKRARVQTGTGSGGFRIDGYVDAAKIPVVTRNNVAVIAHHLWIAPQREVSVASAGLGKLRIKRVVKRPFSQTFTAWANCSDLGIGTKVAAGWSPPGDARGYVAKKDVELYSDSGSDRSLVTILTPSPDSNGILLWSTERKGAWVHLIHHSDVVIDAWARARDLKALPKGETMDQAVGPVTKRNPPQLKLAATPKVVTAAKAVPVRSGASEKSPVIGEIETGAEVYVLDIVAGWASVLPKNLNVAPHGESSFWAKASELGATP